MTADESQKFPGPPRAHREGPCHRSPPAGAAAGAGAAPPHRAAALCAHTTPGDCLGQTRKEVTDVVKSWATAQGKAVVAARGSNTTSVLYVCASHGRRQLQEGDCGFKLSVSRHNSGGWFVAACSPEHTNACLQHSKPTARWIARQVAIGQGALSSTQALHVLREHGVKASRRQVHHALASDAATQLRAWDADITLLESIATAVNQQACTLMQLAQRPLRCGTGDSELEVVMVRLPRDWVARAMCVHR